MLYYNYFYSAGIQNHRYYTKGIGNSSREPYKRIRLASCTPCLCKLVRLLWSEWQRRHLGQFFVAHFLKFRTVLEFSECLNVLLSSFFSALGRFKTWICSFGNGSMTADTEFSPFLWRPSYFIFVLTTISVCNCVD